MQSPDNVDQIFTVNLAAEAAESIWRLRVQDAASQDTGFINSCTLTLWLQSRTCRVAK